MLSLTLFGHFHATLDGAPLQFPTQSASALLAYLILEQRAPHPRTHLSTLLWPDSSEEQGHRNLRQTLLRVRRTLPDTADGQSPLLTVHNTVQWNPDYPVETDIHRFEGCMAQAEPFLHTPLTETPYPAIAPLQAALDLYTADLLLGFDFINDFYADWLQPRRLSYQRRALAGLFRLAHSYGEAGLLQPMERLARQQIALAPEREEAHLQLMRACLAQGEYSAALTQYALYARRLQEIGLEPSPVTQRLHQLARDLRLGRAASPDPIPHNIPQEATPFYGRQQELEDLLLWLVSPNQRLMTLQGLGGMGKTRLALAAARHFTRPRLAIPPRFPDGVWFVSLAEIESDNEEMVAGAIAQGCGWQIHGGETALASLIRYLSAGVHLLILDNLEHLPGMARLILQLLSAAPSLTVLTTSRHRLGLQQEVVRQLSGLPLPRHEGDLAADSVSLLAERMQRVDSHFRLVGDVGADLARICNALDGWPLALELAASWAEVMPAGQIAQRVAGNINALRTTMPDLPARHRSIAAALNGSYLLLTPQQQRVLARFAILRGGCTLEAAQEILAATPEDMALLVRRSLLQLQDGRYAIHELTRQFALEQLEQRRDRADAQRAHANHYLGLLISLDDALHGPAPRAGVHQLRPERENIQQAWRWAVDEGCHDMLRAALPVLLRFYSMTGLLREGEALLGETRAAISHAPLALDLLLVHANLHLRLGQYEATRTLLLTLSPLEDLSLPHQLEAHLLWGKLTMIQDHVPEGRHHNNRAVALARSLDDQPALITGLTQLGMLHDYNAPYHAEVVGLLESLTDRWLQRLIYVFLGAVGIRYSRYRESVTHWQNALNISEELEDAYALVTLHNNLGDALRELGEFAAAEEHFQHSLALSDSLRNEAVRMNSLEGWARLRVLRGEQDDYEQARSLAQEAYDVALAHGQQVGQIVSLSCLGHAFVGLQRWEEAEHAYTRALRVPVSDLPRWSMENVAGLAYVHWRMEDEPAARQHAAQFLALLDTSFVEGSCSPALSYRRVADVLRGLGLFPQADAVLMKCAHD
jgi:predicted ATPase/DNA-binding SARP family transcriptional activator